MRDLPVRRLASTALCASVLIGITGPAAVAADAAREHDRAASRAPVPATEKGKLLGQVRALDAANPALDPVVDLLDQALEKGRLPADEARRLGEAAKQAVAEAATGLKQTAPTAHSQPAALVTPTAAPATPSEPTATATPTASAAPTASVKPAAEATPTASAAPASSVKPATPSVPATSTASTKPATPTASVSPAAPASPAAAVPAALTMPEATRQADLVSPSMSRDVAGDVLSSLQTAIDNLVKAVTGQLDQLLSSAADVVSGLVDLLGVSLTGKDTTASSVESLPSLVTLPTE
ncbi:hypothetical protein [Streptomyces sp. NRRL B-3648]|uniref:hypothetical protein n=1 Tax=Streptomyces sp. NRRL B-3648 TaxID=1519493 RepID=UPI000AAE014F|nr:hypothetical protein [Streptomyces sp. NRRL B-3648]